MALLTEPQFVFDRIKDFLPLIWLDRGADLVRQFGGDDANDAISP